MRIKFGNIVEIKTPTGLAYAIYTHRDALCGAVIRVFSKLHTVRPNDFTEMINGDIQFITIYPLQAAVNRKLVTIIGTVPVPEHLRAFPLFRTAGLPDPKTHRVYHWGFWDGEKEWNMDELTPELRKLPIRGTWNHTLLVDRITEGWKHEMDPG